MRKVDFPTIRRGTTCAGEQLSVDHMIPRAVYPEPRNVIANLDLMPLRANQSKNDEMESREVRKAEQNCTSLNVITFIGETPDVGL